MRGFFALCWLVLASVIAGCAAAPALPTLVEQRQVLERRAMGRYEGGDLQAAAHNFREAVQLAVIADARPAIIVNLLNLGAVESEQGHYEAAAEAFERAANFAEKEHDSASQLRAMAGKAELDYRQGRHASAESLYQRLAAHPAAQGNRDLQRLAFNGLTLCALEIGNEVRAETYVVRAEALGEAAATLQNRATLELRRNALDAAQRAAQRALELDRASGYILGIAGDLELLGEVARRRRADEEAQLYVTQSLALYEQLGMQSAVERLRQRRDALRYESN